MADYSYLALFGEDPEPGKNGAEPAGTGLIAPIGDNLLGATSAFHLRMAEDVAGSVRAWEAMVGNVYLRGAYDAAHLRDIHAHVMQDIYPLPGATRGDERMIAESEARADPSRPKSAEYDTRLGANGENITIFVERKPLAFRQGMNRN